MSLKKLFRPAQEADGQGQEHEDDPPRAEHGDESNWLVSYADMMTLLCGFFIMLFSMAKLDPPRYETVKEAMAKQFGGEYKSPAQEMAKFVTEVVKEAGVDKQTVVRVDAAGVSIAFQSTLFFETLSADVKPEGREVLDRIARQLYDRQVAEGKLYQIVVEGHTDSRPITAGLFPSNWELSGARASRVVRYFLDRRFQADHLTAIGYADTRPEVDPRGPDGRLDDDLLAKNRRVVLRILSPNADSIPLPRSGRAPAEEARPSPSPQAAGAKP